jgi:putative SOS response-associated peptidase YedK
VILDPAGYDRWLDTERFDRDELIALLQPYPEQDMQVQPVSQRVNSVRNDDPQCVEGESELF